MSTIVTSPAARLKQKGSKSGKWLVFVLLVLGLSVTLAPFIWMIFGSFKTASEIIHIPPTFFPENPTMVNYQTLFSDPKLPLLRF